MLSYGKTLLAVSAVLLAAGCGSAQTVGGDATTAPPDTVVETTIDQSALSAPERDAVDAAIARLERFHVPDTPPLVAQAVALSTLQHFNDVNGSGGADPGVADKEGYFVAVDGALEVQSPPSDDGTVSTTPFEHAYILVGPSGDEMALRVTNDDIDLSSFDPVPPAAP